MSITERELLTAGQETCPKRVDTGTLAWRCAVAPLHLGPCAARESPASITRRDAWHAEQAVTGVVSTEDVATAPVAHTMPHQARLSSEMLVSPVAREANLVGKLSGQTMQDLPAWAQAALLGQMAQASLAALTALCDAEFAKGAVEVVISKEFIGTLITPSLRALFDAIIRE